jgi:hypothetical protein
MCPKADEQAWEGLDLTNVPDSNLVDVISYHVCQTEISCVKLIF